MKRIKKKEYNYEEKRSWERATHNKNIKEKFTHLYPIEEGYHKSFESVSRLVMLDRYAQKDRSLSTLQVNDLVIVVLEEDPTFPARGIGYVREIDGSNIRVEILEDYIKQEHPEFIDKKLTRTEYKNDETIVNGTIWKRKTISNKSFWWL